MIETIKNKSLTCFNQISCICGICHLQDIVDIALLFIVKRLLHEVVSRLNDFTTDSLKVSLGFRH